MKPAPPEDSTCPKCGGVLEKTPSGELGCMSCLLRAGIGSEEQTVHDSTLGALEGGLRFGVYEIDCREDGRLYELGRGAMRTLRDQAVIRYYDGRKYSIPLSATDYR